MNLEKVTISHYAIQGTVLHSIFYSFAQEYVQLYYPTENSLQSDTEAKMFWSFLQAKLKIPHIFEKDSLTRFIAEIMFRTSGWHRLEMLLLMY